MKRKLFSILGIAALLLQACDKIEPPYGEGSPPAQTNSVTIDMGTITGSIIDYTVTSATESDTSVLYATWTYLESSDTSYASVIFTWNGIKSDSITSFTTPLGSVHFDDTLSIAAGSPFGTLTFHYIADINANGNGEGTVIVIIVGQGLSRKVLLIDFTGHKCIFCPRGDKQEAILEGIYGEQLIAVAAHAGNFAAPNLPPDTMYTYDYRTPEGTELNTDFNNGAYPSGTVNIKAVNGNYALQPSAWGSAIANLLKLAPDADVQVTNNFNNVTRELTTSVNINFLSSLTADYNLAVYLTEDSIITWQTNGDLPPGSQNVPDYVHMHVLRTSFTGTYGMQIASSPVANTSVQKQYTLTLNAGYQEEHCHVVAFILNSVTKEVVQVGKQAVIN